jgi:hypothetical protein
MACDVCGVSTCEECGGTHYGQDCPQPALTQSQRDDLEAMEYFRDIVSYIHTNRLAAKDSHKMKVWITVEYSRALREKVKVRNA